MNLIKNQINYVLIKEENATMLEEWLDNHNILIDSTHSEGKSVIAERLIKTLKAEIYKKKIANDSKSDLNYLNKLVDKYNNTYHSVNKKPVNADYYALSETLIPLITESGITKNKNTLTKGCITNWPREILLLDLF